MTTMTDVSPVAALTAAITDGEFDAYLTTLKCAVETRLAVLAPPVVAAPAGERLTMADLRVGDKVRIRVDSGLSPKYILGVTGVVKSKLQKNLSIAFDPGQYTGRFGSGVRVRPHWVEKI